MKVRTIAVGAVLALVAATALIVSAAGSASRAQDTFLAGVVSDVGRFNDKGFNQLSLKGCKSGARKAQGTCRALESRSTGDYLPNFARLQRDGADISIATGFLLAEGLATVAKRFPDGKFTIVDYSIKAPPLANAKGKPLFKNIVGLTFATNENAYMIGCLAGLMAKRDGGNIISAVGGIKLPTVDIFIAAYRAGARKCAPGTRTLIDYSQDFVDQAKCKELALNQISEGSQVVFQVAGGCGLGALDAASERNVAGIGVDADQGHLGDHIISSALKRVDTAVYTAAQEVQDGSFQGGADTVFDLKSEGVGLGELNADAQKYSDQLQEVQQQIIDGEIADIPTEVR